MAIFGNKMTKDATDAKKASATKKVAPKKTAVAPKKAEAVKTESMQDLYADKKETATTAKKEANTKFDGAFRVLVRPLVTEKAANFGTLNKYAFIVSDYANKIEVAKAVYSVYGVKAVAVNIICVKGKAVSRGRIKGRRSDLKKAIVTLKKGETIRIYEGV